MIICLEGINGSGKTTLAHALARRWPARGGTARVIDPIQLTDYGRRLRAAIMAMDQEPGGVSADAETLAFVAARLHGAHALTTPLRDAANLLIVERWAGAITAYGTVAGTNPHLLKALETTLSNTLPIDHTVLIDVPGVVAAERLHSLDDQNRFETLGATYLERVRRQYLTWADIRGVPVIDGTKHTEQAAGDTYRLLKPAATATYTSPSGTKEQPA